jgi:ABC-2 type transport system permease protein
MNAIYILWLRQLIRHFRSRARVFGSLGQPLLFMIALGFGFGPVFARAGQGNYLEFLVPGVVAQSILFSAVFSGVEIIWDRQFGFLKETMVAPVSRFAIMFGRTLGGATVAIFQGMIVFLMALLLGFRFASLGNVFLAVVYMSLIALLFTSLGTAIASTLEDFQGFQLILNLFVMPLFFLSGALYPLKGVPKFLEVATRLDPLTYGVDAVRGALVGTYQFSASLDLFVLVSLTLLLLGIGSYLFSKIQL